MLTDNSATFPLQISLVMVAFAWAYVVGIFLHENIKQIKIKKHGNRAKSLFKYGLQAIATALLNPLAKLQINVFEFLSCTLLSHLKFICCH
jgi:hypothetical protein